MARDPGSVWAPLPEAGAPDGYVKTQFIVHSTGDNASADRIRNYFAQIGVVVESTFIVGMDESDPTLQVMDSTDNADANLTANQRAISVEVVGDGTGPFTEWQVKEIIRLGRWAAEHHPIARRIIPSPDASGFGWHVMFGAPGPWTSVRGKVCPGDVRIGQLKDRVFPAIFADAPAPSEEDDDDMKYPFFLYRNRDTTQVVLAAPGIWYGLSNNDYLKLARVRGLCRPDGFDSEVPNNEFGWFRSVFTSSEVNDGQLSDMLATLLEAEPATVDADLKAQIAEVNQRLQAAGTALTDKG